jgi:hypothetical protein
MEILATIKQLLPIQTGQGKNGEWRKQEVIVETQQQYPKNICLSVWGDKINESLLVVGSTLKFSLEIESREYNGRWYTDVKAWKYENSAVNFNSTATDRKIEIDPKSIDSTFLNEEDDGDLPF